MLNDTKYFAQPECKPSQPAAVWSNHIVTQVLINVNWTVFTFPASATAGEAEDITCPAALFQTPCILKYTHLPRKGATKKCRNLLFLILCLPCSFSCSSLLLCGIAGKRETSSKLAGIFHARFFSEAFYETCYEVIFWIGSWFRFRFSRPFKKFEEIGPEKCRRMMVLW